MEKKKEWFHVQRGIVYYDTGEKYFEGYYDTVRSCGSSDVIYPSRPLILLKGTTYYRNGNKHMDGLLQISGLLVGRIYYPDGQLKFEGVCNDKFGNHTYESNGKTYYLDGTYLSDQRLYQGGSYFGPSYPIKGKYYDEDGKLIYQGIFQKTKIGCMCYPRIVVPEGYKVTENFDKYDGWNPIKRPRKIISWEECERIFTEGLRERLTACAGISKEQRQTVETYIRIETEDLKKFYERENGLELFQVNDEIWNSEMLYEGEKSIQDTESALR